MPRDETRHHYDDEEKGQVLDPTPERRRYLTDALFKFVQHKVSAADMMKFPRKKLSRLAEIGYVKYKYGRYAEAMQIFKTLATLDSVNGYYHTALGGVYQKMGKFVDSVVCYTRALRINEKDVCPYVNRGEIYLRHKNYRKAADDFKKAILLDAQGKNLWSNRARSLVIALKRNMDLQKRRVAPPPARRPPPNPPARRPR